MEAKNEDRPEDQVTHGALKVVSERTIVHKVPRVLTNAASVAVNGTELSEVNN
jgi:hypothetical protein